MKATAMRLMPRTCEPSGPFSSSMASALLVAVYTFSGSPPTVMLRRASLVTDSTSGSSSTARTVISFANMRCPPSVSRLAGAARIEVAPHLVNER